jgi:hypothetical protein
MFAALRAVQLWLQMGEYLLASMSSTSLEARVLKMLHLPMQQQRVYPLLVVLVPRGQSLCAVSL